MTKRDATLIKLAEGILDRAYDIDVEEGRNAYNYCGHCRARVYWDDDVETIVHKDDCVVLLARTLLEG